jgi:hypothetical protein
MGNECREMYSAMPAQTVETRQVGDRVEKGITPGESQAIVLNAVELDIFETDELRGWSGDTTTTMKGWYCREGKTDMSKRSERCRGRSEMVIPSSACIPTYSTSGNSVACIPFRFSSRWFPL